MDVDFNEIKVHDSLLNLNVEKFKASIARLLPSRRLPSRSKLIKTRDEDQNNVNDSNHKGYKPDSMHSESPAEKISTKEFDRENSATKFAPLPHPTTATIVAAVPGHHNRSAITSPAQTNETSSQKSISEKTLTPVDDRNVTSDSNKPNFKTRSPIHWTKLKLRTSTKADTDFLEAKSELESALQRVLRSKGENLKVQQTHSANKENLKNRPKVTEPTVYPKRISFVTEEGLKETIKRLRRLDINRLDLQSEINHKTHSSSIENSTAVEPDKDSHTESECKESLNTTDATANLTNDYSFNNAAISSTATTTHESGERCNQSQDFELVSDSSLEKAIFSDTKAELPTNGFNDSRLCQSAELELPSTSIRELTAKVMGHRDETRNQNTSLLMPKGADIYELLRKFEKRVADETAAVTKQTTENSWKSYTSGTDMRRRSKTSKDENSTTPVKVTNDSWIRTTKLPDPFQPNTATSSTTNIVRATAWSSTSFETRAWDSVETPLVARGRVLEALESLRQSSSSSDFEPHSQRFRRSNDSQEMDELPLKVHSIAGDNVKNVRSTFSDTYVTSQFCEKLLSPQASDQLRTAAVNVQGVETLGLVAEVPVPAFDIQKPKKVEFGKTESHFSALEPCKRTVETDQKPRPTYPYRYKRRSLSASPKMVDLGSGCIELGDYQQHQNVKVSHDSKIRTNRRRSFNASNSNYSPLTRAEDNLTPPAVLQKKDDVLEDFDFTSRDDQQVETLSSMSSSSDNIRRASWAVLDENELTTTADDCSTKTNFEEENFVEIAKFRKQSAERVTPQLADNKMLEKSRFDSPRIEEEDEEEVSKATNSTNVHVERPKINSEAVNNVFQAVRPEDAIAAAEKFATVLQNLNDTKKAEVTPVPLITGAHDSNYPPHHPDTLRTQPTPRKEPPIPHRLIEDRLSSRICTQPRETRHVHRTSDASTHKSRNSRVKTDHRPVTIIHHGVRLQDKWFADAGRSAHRPVTSTPKSEFVDSKSRSRKSTPSSKESKEHVQMIGIGGGSLRKKTSTASTADRERLYNSGRDSWLNLPKECKSTASNATAERKEPARGLKIGDTHSVDADSKHSTHSHHSSRLPTPSSSARSKKGELVDVVGRARSEATDRSRNTRDEITSATHRDASSREHTTSHHTTHRKQSSKPATTLSEKPRLRLIDRQDRSRGTPYAKIRSTTGADVTPSAKLSLVRNSSNSSLGSRSNSYEFKHPVLKTEERSKQRAARELQRAASREASIRRDHTSSSDENPWASDLRSSRAAIKPKPGRKVTSTKVSRPEATRQPLTCMRAPPKSKPTRNTTDGSSSSRITRPM